LESHCANSSLHWNFRRTLLKKRSPIAHEMLPKDLPHSISNHNVNQRSWARLQVGMPTSDGCWKKNSFFK
jgi:hypothetical protein